MLQNSPAVAWLFPGQGSQEVGMGAKLLKRFESARQTIALAEQYCGLDLVETMQRGPDSKLSRTEYAQPAMVALSCAYVDLMRDAGHSPHIVAGHSLGELSALYAANVLELHDVLRLAAVRGKLMGRDAIGGMLAVKSCELDVLEAIIADIADGIVCIANLNAPSQIIVSGDDEGLTALSNRIQGTGAQAVRLNVGGAWHSPLVAVAALEFEKELHLTTFSEPTCEVAISSNACLTHSAEDIKRSLIRQMTSSVRWHETIKLIRDQGCSSFYEMGCGKVLKGLMRRILPATDIYSVSGIDNSQTLETLLQAKNANRQEQQEAV